MKDFDQWMTRQQVSWRATHIACTEWGEQNRKRYPWILPAELWEEGLWQGIRSNSPHPLPDYLRINKVQKHSGVHNLKSSWMLCANLYFPFGASSEGRALLAGFLLSHVSPEIHSVNAIELEYAEGGDLHPSVLLGETGGGRGAGQTSPDLGLLVNEGRGLVLLENKFLEHSFYQCSARRTNSSSIRAGNPDSSRCDNALTVASDPKSQCHQAFWGRRYWQHLAPVVEALPQNPKLPQKSKRCPKTISGWFIKL